jgi:PD-(D/E)XK endonuclease
MTSSKKENQAQANPCAFLLSMKRKPAIKGSTPAAITKKPFVRNAKRRGEIVELDFLSKVAAMGFAVTKPYGDSEPYDFIVDSGNRLWRVQVKSTRYLHKGAYQILAHHWIGQQIWGAYKAEEIDILAAYIIPLDAWYIIPVSAFIPSLSLYFFPHVRAGRGRYEQFRDAWFLMACRRTGEPREGIVTSPACSYCPSSGKNCPGCVQK